MKSLHVVLLPNCLGKACKIVGDASESLYLPQYLLWFSTRGACTFALMRIAICEKQFGWPTWKPSLARASALVLKSVFVGPGNYPSYAHFVEIFWGVGVWCKINTTMGQQNSWFFCFQRFVGLLALDTYPKQRPTCYIARLECLHTQINYYTKNLKVTNPGQQTL